MITDQEVRRRYGADAIVSRHAGFVLVHLDRPSARQVRNRTRRFDPDRFFDPDCPLCRIQRASGVVVFDDYGDAGAEDILLE
jgi:hypothetical protein